MLSTVPAPLKNIASNIGGNSAQVLPNNRCLMFDCREHHGDMAKYVDVHPIAFTYLVVHLVATPLK